MIVKVCRECGEEYRPEILRCADCGGELEARLEEERAAWPEPAGGGPAPPAEDWRPAGDYQPIAWSPHPSELTGLADRLLEAGIPFYLRPREGVGRASAYEIRVREEEREAALELLEAAGPSPAPESVDAGLTHTGSASPSRASGATRPCCPACGHSLAEGAAECPECGLAVGDVTEE